MASLIISPNMNLPVPVAGQESGPQYALDITSCMNLIDSHNHTAGQGVSIPVEAITVNTDIPMDNNNLISVRSVRFQPQSLPLGLVTDIGCIYEVDLDLYYNDGAGNQVRITQNGSVTGTPGSIANLNPPASVSYVSFNETYVFQSNINKPGNLDAGFIILRNNVVGSKGLTLEPPPAMSADFTIVLPTLPSVPRILTIDPSGNMVAQYIIDGNTIIDTGGTLSVSTAPLVDDLTIKSTANVISVKNGYITYEFVLNGPYAGLTVPVLEIDGLRFFNYNATIVNVWAYIVTPGASGTTTIDLKVATSPGGAFSSIFTTKPAFTSAAVANSYVDANGVVSPGTGVTAPVLATTSIAAGSAMKFDLTSVQGGAAAKDVGIIVQFMQRN